MIVKDHSAWLNPALLLVTLALVLGSVFLGPVAMPIGEVLRGLFGAGEPGTAVIIWEVRLPRAIAAIAVGMALGASGAALQGLLHNPLAEPGVLGVSATGSLLATFAIYWGLVAASPWVLPIATIAGALLATGLLAVLAPRVGSVVTLVLIGVGLSSFAGALMSLLLTLAPNPFSLSEMVNWMMGSVANRSFDDIALAGPFWLGGMALLLLAAPGLRALGLGEEAAAAVGLNVGRARLLVVLGAGLATGAGVAVAGAIGFVGIVAPHLMRPLVGHDPARALVPSALFGGIVLVLADLIARLAPGEQELKLGVVAALIGAPVFIAIAARRRAQEGTP
jgi:iron complex transport system permease protein